MGIVNAADITQVITLAGSLTTSGANPLTLTTSGTTNVTLPTSGTLVNTGVTTLSSLASVGTIATGVWQGTIVTGTYGGTGINNGANTITLGGNLTTSGAFNTTLISTAGTSVTLPTSGTLVNSAVATLSSLTSIGTIGTGVWQGTPVGVVYGGTGLATLTTAYGVVCAGTTATGALQNTGAGTSGQLLISNGPSALPTFQTYTPTAGPGTTNFIIGGNADTNPWQLGTSFPTVSGGTGPAMTADAWGIQTSGPGIMTFARTTNAPTAAQSGISCAHSFGITVGTAAASPGSGDYYQIYNRLDGYSAQQFVQESFTVSFWVYATVTGTSSICLDAINASCFYIATYTITTTLTWQYVTLTIPAPGATGSWNTSLAACGLSINFPLAMGSTYTGAAGSWRTGAVQFAGTGQVNHMSSTSNVFYVNFLQINAGSTASAFQYRNYVDELQLCQRFFSTSFSVGVTPAQNHGTSTGEQLFSATKAGAAAQISPYIPFPVRMNPYATITIFSPGDASGNAYDETAGAVCSSTSVTSSFNDRGFQVTFTGASGTTVGGKIGFHWTASNPL